jgi:hypothetical protein
MSRSRGDPNQLIARLEAAAAKAGPKSVADAALMAEIVGMTWRNLLKTYIEPDKDFPIVARGSEGVAWQFNIRAVLKHLIKRAQQRIDANLQRVQERASLLGFTVPDEEQGLSFADVTRLADLTYRVENEKVSQGERISRDRHRLVVGGLMMKLRDSLQGSISRIDPAGKLPPVVKEALTEQVTAIMLTCHKDAQAFLEESRAPTKPPRNRRTARQAVGG